MKVTEVNFAGLILGKIYVAATFENGVTRHYWLQEPPTWQPNTIYGLNDIVQPQVPNGFYYRTATKSTAPAWAPEQAKQVGDVVQPTTPNGWEYVVTDVTGSASTGETEPAWPTAEGAQVFEGTDSTTVPSTSGSSSTSDQQKAAVSQAIKDRYGLGDDA